jgi:hypothetical protein
VFGIDENRPPHNQVQRLAAGNHIAEVRRVRQIAPECGVIHMIVLAQQQATHPRVREWLRKSLCDRLRVRLRDSLCSRLGGRLRVRLRSRLVVRLRNALLQGQRTQGKQGNQAKPYKGVGAALIPCLHGTGLH